MSWTDNIREITPYVPGEQPKDPDIIKLNTNENPYPPSPKVSEVLKTISAEYDLLRKYPDADMTPLVNALARTYALDPDCVFAGVGSDDVLAMSFITFFNSDKPILFPDVTYSFYPVWADLFGIKYKQIPVREDFTIDPDDYLQPNGGIVIANPNAPTSIYMGADCIEKIVKHNPDSVVIIDEAYIDFGGQSVLPLIDRYDNLLVVRTFSKSRSLAGARIGMAFGCSKLISYLRDVKFSINSYTMSHDVLRIGAASLEDEDYFTKTTARIIDTRNKAAKRLKEMGFTCLPSSTNFLFVTHASKPAKEIFTSLREKAIYVRYFNLPRIDNYLRITIGTPEEMEKLYDALNKIL